MRITPLDIRKQEFRKVVRGMDCDEVNAFMTTVADEYEAVLVDNKQLRERILEQDDKINEYRTMERTLRDTLMTAERVLAEAKENALKEASLIIKDAELDARRIVDHYRPQAENLRREILALQKEKEAYLARFKSLAEAQIQFIENHESDFQDFDQRMLEQAEKMTRKTSETMPQRPVRDSRPTTPRPSRAGAPPSGAWRDAARPGETSEDQWRDYTPGLAPTAKYHGSKNARPDSIADLPQHNLAAAAPTVAAAAALSTATADNETAGHQGQDEASAAGKDPSPPAEAVSTAALAVPETSALKTGAKEQQGEQEALDTTLAMERLSPASNSQLDDGPSGVAITEHDEEFSPADTPDQDAQQESEAESDTVAAIARISPSDEDEGEDESTWDMASFAKGLSDT